MHTSLLHVLGFRARSGSAGFTAKYESLIETIRSRREEGTLCLPPLRQHHHGLRKSRAGEGPGEGLLHLGVLNDFSIRGGIGKGSVTRYEEVTEPDKIVFPFLGEGYLRATHEPPHMSGISLDDTLFQAGEMEGFKKEIDYVEYEEHLPKMGYEGRKHLLLPSERSVERIINSMDFEEMLQSHVEDIDKYVNTFCFYVNFLLQRAGAATIRAFQKNLLAELDLHGRSILIPRKVMIIFIVVVEGLLARFQAQGSERYVSADQFRGGYQHHRGRPEGTGSSFGILSTTFSITTRRGTRPFTRTSTASEPARTTTDNTKAAPQR